ncbi:hypothetical protein SAMN05216382_1740 [Sphingomonas palmae]|uniref:Beta-barrel porin-2, OmpL-like. bbp2 n=1 Tax=Sphingomonas palmae TaxID=1855283 RepID=A0A1H7P1K4_9SPHN|nr:hypothetical protein [Sphingomonas palmae]SEL29691.1 hypothetical protein SAMN05216382_1740 [Sphingomonas palmae]
MYRPLLLAACAAGALLPFAASAQHHHDMPIPAATPAGAGTPSKAPARRANAKRRAAPARTRVSRPPASAATAQAPIHANETASDGTAAPDHASMHYGNDASMHAATSDAANSGADDRGASPAGTDHAGMDHAAMNHISMNHMGGAHARMDHSMSFTAPPAWRDASDAALAHAPVGAAMSDMTMGTAGGWYTPGSGTARLPAGEGPMRGAMFSVGDWMVMAHGYAWGTLTDQGGPRGGDMAFVQSMAMLMADRDLSDRVHLQLRGMGSLEPLMGRRGYPNLFATGETANGVPLVDRQHPHDLFMELAARLDYRLGGNTSLFLYGGPVGEPALGPSAFMHRGSARYQPLSPITHHWFDSTHITYGVVTAGVSAPKVQLEGSWFKGREPDERRWDIDPIRLDSWSLRGTWTPSPYLAMQVSHAHLKEPEVQHPGEDENRTTASVQWARNGVSTTFAWSRKDRQPGEVLNAWLAEATWEITPTHAIFARVENVANDELFPDHDDPLHDRRFRVTKAEGGYAYRLPIVGPLGVALGGTVAAYAKPDALDAAYGRTPVSWTLFAKLAVGL